MFAHPQQHEQLHQKLQQQEPAIPDLSMVQSLTDFSALPAMLGMEPLQANPNLLGTFDHNNQIASNAICSQVIGGDYWRDPSKPRIKRGREEDMVASTSTKANIPAGNRQHVWSAPNNNPPSKAASPPPYPLLCFPQGSDSDLLVRMEKDLLELDLFISAQVEKMRAEMEQRRQGVWAGVLRTVEDGLRQALKARDEEIASVSRRNSALEERINVLALEGQTWKALARANETAAAALRRDIELAQQAAAGATGGGGAGSGGEVDDSVSFCEGRRGEEGQGECGGSPRRRCRVCRRDEVSRLVLPCRHLCLCGGCDPVTESCPLCGGQKRASIKVYLS